MLQGAAALVSRRVRNYKCVSCHPLTTWRPTDLRMLGITLVYAVAAVTRVVWFHHRGEGPTQTTYLV